MFALMCHFEIKPKDYQSEEYEAIQTEIVHWGY
jgi:hypothetical protein